MYFWASAVEDSVTHFWCLLTPNQVLKHENLLHIPVVANSEAICCTSLAGISLNTPSSSYCVLLQDYHWCQQIIMSLLHIGSEDFIVNILNCHFSGKHSFISPMPHQSLNKSYLGLWNLKRRLRESGRQGVNASRMSGFFIIQSGAYLSNWEHFCP